MTLQFSDMTSSSIFFDIVLFLLSSLVTGPSFKYLRLSFSQYLKTGGQVRNTKFGTNFSNEMLLNAAKCQGYTHQIFSTLKRVVRKFFYLLGLKKEAITFYRFNVHTKMVLSCHELQP